MTEIAVAEQVKDLEPGRRAALRQRLWDRGSPTAALDRSGDLPASATQRRMAFLHGLAPDSTGYTTAVTYRLTGKLDVGALRSAVDDVLARHAALRTVLPRSDTGTVQRVLPATPLRQWETTTTPEQLAAAVAAEQAEPFDLAAGPLTRVRLFRLGEHESVLLWVFHHAVIDGWSLDVLERDLADRYERHLAGSVAPVEPTTVSYVEFARWQEDWLAGRDADEGVAHWEATLAGAPAVLTLPWDRPRSAEPSPAGSSTFLLPCEVRDALAALGRSTGATPFMVLLAVVQVVLARFAGQTDVVVGTPVAGRGHPRLHDVVGFFANSLALRTAVDADLPFAVLLAQVRGTCLNAYDHQDVPLDVVARRLHPDRELGRNPIYQVNFTLHNTDRASVPMGRLQVERAHVPDTTARFDLDLNVHDTEDGYACVLDHAADLFDTATAERFARALEHVARAVARDATVRIADLPLAGAEELDDARWNSTGTALPGNAVLHGLIRGQAQRTPAAMAVSNPYGDGLTYLQLDRRANALAHDLRSRGVGRGAIVGVAHRRNPGLLVALLGVIKAGAAYLPLDPDHPRNRIDAALRDSGAADVLTEVGADEADVPPDVNVHPDDPAYLIYTSGSTGVPKGVLVSHRSVANYLLWASAEYGLNADSVVPVHTSIAFDLTVTSLFAPLLAGGEVAMLDDEDRPGAALADSFRDDRDLGAVKLTPSHLRLLEGAAPRWTEKLVIGGEELTEAHLAPWRAHPDVRLINEYGPTETAVACAAHDTTSQVAPTGRVPIGRPVHNTTLHVVDSGLRLQPVGVPGELCVGGAGVAHGYWDRAAATAERFVPDPFSPVPGARLYRTGDLVRRNADGVLDFLGRIDDQIKVHGHRVEPAEITALLDAHPAVRGSAVEATANGGLVAFVALDVVHGTETDRRRVAQWTELYEQTYTDAAADPAFDLAGWTSGITGEAIDPGEMAEWVDDTVARVAALRPQRVAEVGCGTGLILQRVAPECRHYLASDVSPTVVARLADHVPEHVELRVASAHRALRADERFDTVVLNSVIQYFPSVSYLADVLGQAVDAVDDGGHVFVGDVRHLGLLETFHASIHVPRAATGTPVAAVRAEVRHRMTTEQELCVDPRFFRDLPGLLPRVRSVRVLPKQGRRPHELTAYRFDVVIEVGTAIHRPAAQWTPWTDLPTLDASLEATPPVVAVRGIPNARLTEDVALAGRLRDARGALPAAELAPRPDSRAASGVDPEDLRNLAGQHGYEIELSWAQGDSLGTFDALISRPGTQPRVLGPDTPPAGTAANDPSWRDRAEATVPALVQLLRDALPAPLVPAQVVALRELPLTPNGKVDRAALRHLATGPAGVQRDPHTPPLSATEQRIAVIWGALLNRTGIRADDDFFDLGGHSLLTFQLVFRLREEFEVEVPIRAPFDASTLAAQAALVDALNTPATLRPELIPVRRDGDMPASWAQERLWFLSMLEPGSTQYNFPVFLRLQGNLEPDVLAEAITSLVGRHEVLRTTIVAVDGQPLQRLGPALQPEVQRVDLTHLPPQQAEQEAIRLAHRQFHEPFDLASPPVLRAALLRVAREHHVLLLTVHHVSIDGWSVGLLQRDLLEIYAALREERRPDLPHLPVQYADYAVWQRRLGADGHLDEHHRYWLDRLRGVLDLPGLPTDHPRPSRPAHTRRALDFRIPSDVVSRLRSLCGEEDTTLFMALLSAVYAVLNRRTGHTDLVVGSDVAGRTDTATENLIGFFVNQVVLRTDLTGRPTLRELLRRTRSTTLDAYAHQEAPFEDIVKELNPPRTRNQTPLFQVKVVAGTGRATGAALPGLQVEPFEAAVIDTSRFDITILLTEADDEVSATWEVDAELFDSSTAERMRAQYLAMVTALADHPDQQIADLPWTDDAEPGARVDIPHDRRARMSGPGARSGPAGLRSTRPRPQPVDLADAVAREQLDGAALPLVLRALRDDIDLAEWASSRRDELARDRHRHGAVLFRGFGVTTAEELERSARALARDLITENGEHPRTAVTGSVFTPTHFAPEEKLLWHNENSFNNDGPATIWFCCSRPADAGGETPIVDSRAVYRDLDPALREEFITKGVRYVRNYGTGLGLDWREVFRTNDRTAVESACDRQGLRFSWHDGRLRTEAVRPAVLRHPVTGEWSWFNQAQHWHTSCLPAEARASMRSEFDVDELPRSCTFGDGTEIPDAAMAEICRVYAALEVTFTWRRGDALMVDNIVTAHARNPFRGDRELLVAMADVIEFR